MKKITFLIALFTILSVNAQWTTDTLANTLVASSNANDIKSIGTSDGQTYVVFWKSVAAPTNFELRVQLLDASGNQQFGVDGVLISNTIPMSTSISFWSVSIDSSNNLYVGVTGTDGNSGHAFKVDVNGNNLFTNPVTFPSAFLVSVLPLDSGEVMVSWFSISTYKASMQKYDSTGNPLWATVQTANLGSSFTAPANLYEISSGNFIMVFHQLGSGINSTLHAQRFDQNGNAIWANPTPISNKTTAYNAIYNGTQDGDTIYYGYSGKEGTKIDSFLQRINADGTIPWGINGVDFDTNETNLEMDTKIAYSPGSSYIWAVCNYSNSSQIDTGEYVQKFDKVTGTRQFTDNAKSVFALGTDKVHVGDLHLIGDQPLFLIKSGLDNGVTPTALNVCLLDVNGDFVWSEEIKPVATFSANKNRIQLNTPVNGQVVTVFVEDKGNGTNIYAQNFADSTLSVVELNFETTIQYINPIQKELKLKSNVKFQTVRIFNAMGQLLSAHKVNSKEIIIDSQSWNPGFYFVKILTNTGREKGLKILKE